MISICMPYFERIRSLMATLKSYSKCGYTDIEVIICDDGSTKEPVPSDINSKFKYSINTVYLPKKKLWKNPAVPLNVAVGRSSGDVILLTSPEIFHPSPVLQKMRNALKNSNDVVLMPTKHMVDGKVKKWLSHPVHRPRKLWWCQMMHKSLYDSIGGFDEDYRENAAYEDDDFVKRLEAAGANWVWAKGSHVVHVYLGEYDGKATVSNRLANKALYEEKHGKKS